jgi:hypothetical protein
MPQHAPALVPAVGVVTGCAKLLMGLLALLCLAFGRGQAEEAGPGFSAQEVEHAVHDIVTQAGADRLWPRFDPLSLPLAVFDGTQTHLFRHPSPPEGFQKAGDAEPPDFVYPGRYERVIANTNVEIGGVSTGTLLLNRFRADTPLRQIAAVALHELFHVFQREHQPHWVANEAQLFTYPVTKAELLALRRQETEALRRALAADGPEQRARWARRALAARTERFGQLAPEFVAYERGTELNEGLATYVEMRAAGRATLDLPAAGFAAADVRRRAYSTGAAWALLLDGFGDEWKGALSADAALNLESVLATALGSGEKGEFDAKTVADLERQAARDVAALVAERKEALAQFDGRSGWRIEIVIKNDDSLLWPQGFDPLNVTPIDPQRTLHTRFLRLGSDGGELEVLNQQSLTEGAGAHPMFNGVRRVVITGLAEPEVEEDQAQVVVRAPGVTLRLERARVQREDQRLRVHID